VTRSETIRTGAYDLNNLPVTLTEFKLHQRIEESGEDDLIKQYIVAASDVIQGLANIALITATYRLTLDEFPAERRIELLYPPLLSVESVQYLDSTGTLQTFPAANYRVLTDGVGSIELKTDESWPETQAVAQAVKINYTAGYPNSAAIPPREKQAVRFLAGHWYENRESVLLGTVSKELEQTGRLLAGHPRDNHSWHS